MLIVISLKSGKFWSINMNGFRVLPQRGSHDEKLHPACLSVDERSFDVCLASVYPTRHISVLAFMQHNIKSWTKKLEPSQAQWKRHKHNSHTCCSKNIFYYTRLTKLPTTIGRRSTKRSSTCALWSPVATNVWKIPNSTYQTRLYSCKIRVSGHTVVSVTLP